MVDSINGAGGVPPVNNSNRAQSRNDVSSGQSASPVDEVSISAEAIDLAQAEQAARDARSILEQRIDAALTGDNVAAALNALDVGE